MSKKTVPTLEDKQYVHQITSTYSMSASYVRPDTLECVSYLHLLNDIDKETALFHAVRNTLKTSSEYITLYQSFLGGRTYEKIKEHHKLFLIKNLGRYEYEPDRLKVIIHVPSKISRSRILVIDFNINNSLVELNNIASNVYVHLLAKFCAIFIAKDYKKLELLNSLLNKHFFEYTHTGLTILKKVDESKSKAAAGHLCAIVENIVDAPLQDEIKYYFLDFYTSPTQIMDLLYMLAMRKDFDTISSMETKILDLKGSVPDGVYFAMTLSLADSYVQRGEYEKALEFYLPAPQELLEECFAFFVNVLNALEFTGRSEERAKIFSGMLNPDHKYLTKMFFDPTIAAFDAISNNSRCKEDIGWNEIYQVHLVCSAFNKKLKSAPLDKAFGIRKMNHLIKFSNYDRYLMEVANFYKLYDWVIERIKSLPHSNRYAEEERKAYFGMIDDELKMEEVLSYLQKENPVYTSKIELYKVFLSKILLTEVTEPGTSKIIDQIEALALSDDELTDMIKQGKLYVSLVQNIMERIKSQGEWKFHQHGDKLFVYFKQASEDEDDEDEDDEVEDDEEEEGDIPEGVFSDSTLPILSDDDLKKMQYSASKIHDFFQQKKQQMENIEGTNSKISQGDWHVGDRYIKRSEVVDLFEYRGKHYYAIIAEKKIHLKDNSLLGSFYQALEKGFVDRKMGVNGVKLWTEHGIDKLFELKINMDKRLYTSEVYQDQFDECRLIIFDHAGSHNDVENWASGHTLEFHPC